MKVCQSHRLDVCHESVLPVRYVDFKEGMRGPSWCVVGQSSDEGSEVASSVG